MFIKEVIIEGFKTYKDATRISFSPHHNIILGKNGSGKSNIFEAIQFVLSDKHSGLAPNRRHQLLHEGQGRDTISASVEIIFDNSDNRFLTGGDKATVSLKRTIGLKKDDYFLDNKHVTKQDVVSLLEGAGLSKSNPYYIVQQGKISQLVKMKDSERLNLLKDIAGTKTYDDRRKESQKIMKETDERLARIAEVIKFIERRLSELDSEKKELSEWQALDTERRALEYALYDHELKDATAKLAQIDAAKTSGGDHTEKLHAAVASTQKARRDNENEAKILSEELVKMRSAKGKLDKQRTHALAAKAKIELQVRADSDQVGHDRENRNQAKEQLQQLLRLIADAEQKLAELAPDLDAKATAEKKLQERSTGVEARLAELYAKQNRTKFKSRAERDKFLNGEIKTMQKQLAAEQEHVAQYQAEIEHFRARETDNKKAIASKENEIKKFKTDVESAANGLKQLKEQKEAAVDARKAAWKKSNDILESLRKATHDADTAASTYKHQLEKNTSRGLDFIRRLQDDGKERGLYGPLIDLFSCDAKFYRPVESTAGNALFHIVVDTDATASRIIQMMTAEKAGRLTFIPLNRISPKEVSYPKASDAFPMLEKLTFDERYRKAMVQVFGKTLIARTLEVAAQFAKQYDLDTITLNGDKVSRKGSMFGGYLDASKAKLAAYAAHKTADLKRQELQVSADREKELAERADQAVARLTGEIQKVDETRKEARNALAQLELDMKTRNAQRMADSKAIDRNAQLVDTATTNAKLLDNKIQSSREELKADITDALTATEKSELDTLNAESTELAKQLRAATRERTAAATKKTALENKLQGNLLKRQEELKAVMDSPDEHSEQLERDNSDLKEATARVEELDQQLKGHEKSVDEKEDRLRRLHNTLDDLKSEEARAQRALATEAKTASRTLHKRGEFFQKKIEAQRKINELALPADAFDKFSGKSPKQLLGLLDKTNTQLKKYSHVNKKAIQQFEESTSQKNELLRRRKELDKGRKAILELIEHLDKKKDEAINRTFKGIAVNFTAVFAELVPGGKAQLSMKLAEKGVDVGSQASSQGDEKGKKDQKSEASQYVGIDFEADFGSGKKRGLEGWSGGQRSVLALALIFAIQRCDPSPFYLFDEVDAALDPVYRQSLADMIRKQKTNTQFLTTTFRSEMIPHADKLFGVTFNKVSQVKVLNAAEAAALIQVVESELASGAGAAASTSAAEASAVIPPDAEDMDEKA